MGGRRQCPGLHFEQQRRPIVREHLLHRLHRLSLGGLNQFGAAGRLTVPCPTATARSGFAVATLSAIRWERGLAPDFAARSAVRSYENVDA